MRMKEVLILGLLVILLQVVDGVVTGYVVSTYGAEMENNPLARWLMKGFGVTSTVIAFKAMATAGVLFVMWAAWKHSKSRGFVCRCLWVALGAYLVMAWQWAQALQALSAAAPDVFRIS